MNKFESKYQNTALLMNQALIELLNQKDYNYISIKEICKKAGVNRSTFYLHYDNIDDLLCESIQNVNKNFLSYFKECSSTFTQGINNMEKKDLILIKPEYLLPYLNYIKENIAIFQVSVKHPIQMRTIENYNLLNKEILFPIFKRFNIEEKRNNYISAYYLNGISAIINEWILNDCKDDVNYICDIIIECIRPIEK